MPVRHERPQPVGVEVDGQLHREEAREHNVEPAQQVAQLRGGPVGAGEAAVELRLRDVEEEVLRRGHAAAARARAIKIAGRASAARVPALRTQPTPPARTQDRSPA